MGNDQGLSSTEGFVAEFLTPESRQSTDKVNPGLGSRQAINATTLPLHSPESPSTSVTTSTMTEDISEHTTSKSLESRSLRVLQKKISKTLHMMKLAGENERKGKDSKLYRRLVEKLQQYEMEITVYEKDVILREKESTNDTTGHADPLLSPISIKEVSSSLHDILPPLLTTPDTASEILIPNESVVFIPPPALQVSPATPNAKPVVLQRRSREMEKLMSEMIEKHGEKVKMETQYKELEGKQTGYKMALTEFEERMKQQACNESMAILLLFPEKKKRQEPKKSPETKCKGQKSKTGGRKKSGKTSEVDHKKKKSTRDRKSRPKKTKSVSAVRIQELGKEFKPRTYEKDEIDEELIRQTIRANFVFEKLSNRSVQTLVEAFEPTKIYAPGELIIRQGEEIEPMYFFIIRCGEVEYEVDGETLGIAGPGKSFGEQGLLYSCKRKASVRAISPTQLLRLDQITYRYLLQNQTKFYRAWRQATRTIMAMNRLLEVASLAKKLKENSDHIKSDIREPEANDSLEGSFHFDEEEDEKSELAASTIAEMSSRREWMMQSFHESEVSVNDFSRKSVLGEGQYGEVWMVKPTNIERLKDQDFALKIQAKVDTLRDSTPGMTITVAEAIKRECEVLAQFCHPFICEFVHMFEDEINVYLVMGVIRGIELWNVIHRENDDGDWDSGISEDNAKFYCALIADTLRYMHRRKVCYRDLKPENIMVNEKGYPIFVDFGFAKHIPNGTTYTFCGTPRYTCPEIIGNQGHGFPVDWWAFGVVIFEMISGENPFYYDGIAEMQLLEDIVHNDPESLGEDFSADVKDLVSKLLIKDPFTRLGTLNPNDVLKHPWLASIDLVKGRDQLLEPPFLPLALQD